MTSFRSSEGLSASKTQPELTGTGAPAPTPSSLESPLAQVRVSFGGPSHPPHITQNLECHREPVRDSCFTHVGRDVLPLERIPCEADHEVAAATAPPSTPVHQRRQPEQAEGVGVRRRHRIGSSPVNHTEHNDRLIRSLEPHLQSLIRFHFGSSEELQVYALNRILEGFRQLPPVHICRFERKNGDRKGMIMLVICLLCPSNPTPSRFEKPNALPKFAHHFRTFHCEIKTPFECVIPLCDKAFSLRHDMVRHVKAAHYPPHTTSEQRQSDVSTGYIEDANPDPFAASNVAGPSNGQTAGNFPLIPPTPTRNNGSPSPHVQISVSSKSAKKSSARRHRNVMGSAPGLSPQVEPYPARDVAVSHTTGNANLSDLSQSTSDDILTMMNDGGTGREYGAAPSTSHQAGHMATGNQNWVACPSSSGHLSMSFHDAQIERYGGLSHTPALSANELAAYLRSCGQTIRSPFPSSGTHSQNQSRQHDHPTMVTQISQMIGSDYTMNAMSTDLSDGLPQLGSNFVPTSSIQGSRQLAPFPAATSAVTQEWQNTNDTSMNAYFAQARHGQDGYNGVGDPGQGMSRQYRRRMHVQPVMHDSTHPTLPPHDAETTLQNQYLLQQQPNRPDVALNHDQQATYLPWQHPRNPTDMTLRSRTLTPSSQSQGYTNTGYYRQTEAPSAKPRSHAGGRVSYKQGALKRAVIRSLSSRLGLIRLMVGVSGTFLSAISGVSCPSLGKKEMAILSLFLSWEGEVDNIDLWFRRCDHVPCERIAC